MSSDSENDYQQKDKEQQQVPVSQELAEDKNFNVADNFLELFQNQQVDIARVEDRESERASKVDKTAFSEQALQKMRLKQIAVLLKDFGWDDRHEWLNYMKNKANSLVREQKYDQAIQVYMESAVGIDLSQGQSEEQIKIMKKEFQVTILSNLAICYKKKKQYDQALTFHKMVIFFFALFFYARQSILTLGILDRLLREHTPMLMQNNPIWRCKMQNETKIFMKSKDCNLAQSLVNPDNYDSVQQDIQIIKKRVLQSNQQEKQVYQKMFSAQEEKKIDPPQDEKNRLLEPKQVMDVEQEEIIIKRNKYVNMLSKGWDFLIRVFGCKRLFIDEDEEDDINIYKQEPDESEEDRFPQRQEGSFFF